MNQKEYAEKYCENKTKPELNCLGSCHLSEQLQLTNNIPAHSTEEVFSVVVSVLAFQQIQEVELALDKQEEQSPSYLIASYTNNQYLSPIFRPPIFI
ncbi:MAG: hypothetical protein N4A35_06045 [Flavobacteriales bacterium]|nr:hypothetical protein [Flavobacteriales bacterium]